MSFLFKGLLTAILAISISSSALCQDTPAPKELTRKEKRQLKRNLRKLKKIILNDPHLARKYFDIIEKCQSLDEYDCQQQLSDAVDDTVADADLKKQASGMTFGICKIDDDAKATHGVVYSKKSYNCKLSSHGLVYDKSVSRKLYGPGIWWDKQSIVLMCTGPAYGKRMSGFSVAAGAYYGITLTTLVGDVGLCLVVGAGKSAGVYVGADSYKFESLE